MSKNIKIADLIPEAVPTPPRPEVKKDFKRITKIQTFGGKEFEVVYRKGIFETESQEKYLSLPTDINIFLTSGYPV
jgi:hypothetical protein